MSMQINGPISNCTFRWAEQGVREVPAVREDSENRLPQMGKHAELPRNTGVQSSEQRRQQHLEVMAERLAAQTSAAVARFDEMGARWNERFDSLEARALESGNDLGAERISEIGEKTATRLDDVSDKFVAHFDEIFKRIGTVLSESYGVIGDDVSNLKEPAVDEVA